MVFWCVTSRLAPPRLVSALDGNWAPVEQRIETKVKEKAQGAGAALSPEAVNRATRDSVRALMLIRAYRIRGHLHADLDPLKLRHVPDHGELKPATYGFGPGDLDRPIFIDNVLGLEVATMRQICELMKRTYCGTFALQYMHISNPEEAAWLKERIEGYGKEIAFTRNGRRAILNKLVEAEGFEKFLHVKYMGTKRFGLDGGEALIPAMEQIIKRGGALGARLRELKLEAARDALRDVAALAVLGLRHEPRDQLGVAPRLVSAPGCGQHSERSGQSAQGTRSEHRETGSTPRDPTHRARREQSRACTSSP